MFDNKDGMIYKEVPEDDDTFRRCLRMMTPSTVRR